MKNLIFIVVLILVGCDNVAPHYPRGTQVELMDGRVVKVDYYSKYNHMIGAYEFDEKGKIHSVDVYDLEIKGKYKPSNDRHKIVCPICDQPAKLYSLRISQDDNYLFRFYTCGTHATTTAQLRSQHESRVIYSGPVEFKGK